MTYTAHGHHIEGTEKNPKSPKFTARCGGPGLCAPCSKDAIRVLGKLKKELKENV